MRSAVYSLFTTLMLLVAVSAVPLMAVFGVPQFTPADTASLDAEIDDEWDRPVRRRPKPLTRAQRIDDPELELTSEEPPDWERPHGKRALRPRKRSSEIERREAIAEEESEIPFTDHFPEDAAEEFDDSPPVRRAHASLPDDAPDAEIRQVIHEVAEEPAFRDGESNAEMSEAPREILAGEAVPLPATKGFKRQRRSSAETDDPQQRMRGNARRNAAAAKPPTWSEAVQRLNQLGIRNFRLEPGVRPGQFSFTCSYTHSASPHVTRKFEADANEPLKAVGKVLAQVETWSEAREEERDPASPRQMLETVERRERAD